MTVSSGWAEFNFLSVPSTACSRGNRFLEASRDETNPCSLRFLTINKTTDIGFGVRILGGRNVYGGDPVHTSFHMHLFTLIADPTATHSIE